MVRTDLITVNKGVVELAIRMGLLKKLKSSDNNIILAITEYKDAILVVMKGGQCVVLDKKNYSKIKDLKIYPHLTGNSNRDGKQRAKIRFSKNGKTCSLEHFILNNVYGLHVEVDGEKLQMHHAGYTFDLRENMLANVSVDNDRKSHQHPVFINNLADLHCFIEWLKTHRKYHIA